MSAGTDRTSSLLLAAKIVLLVTFVATTNRLLVDRLDDLLSVDNYLAVSVFLLIWAIGMLSLVIAAWLPRPWLRIGWAVPIAVSTFFGDFAYGLATSHLTFYDVVLYWSERPLWLDAAVTHAPSFAGPLLRAAVGVVAIALPHRATRLVPRSFALAPVVPFVLISTLLLARGGMGTRALPEQYNALSMFAVMVVSDPFDLSGTRRPISIEAGTPLARHVVLIVDESVSGDFIDLNGARGVTPVLLDYEQDIANFGYAVSANNCSLFSNLVLRFGGDSAWLAMSLRSGPSIWAYARAAGFRTVYLDGQQTNGRLQNGMNIIERRGIDDFIQFDDVERIERDLAIAIRLRELLKSDDRVFIYVNKKGSHFPYRLNYPDSASVYRPDMERGEPVGKSRERLVNSYRNSILWNTDRFFRELFRDGIPNGTMVYTSDHGQNLMDRGVMLQCNSRDPQPFEGLVPLLLISGEPELRSTLQAAADLNRDRATHFQIFPTLLELFGYGRDDVAAHFPEGLLAPVREQPLRFSFGPIVGSAKRHIRWRTMPTELRQLTRQVSPHRAGDPAP